MKYDIYNDIKNYKEFTPFSFRVLRFKEVGSDNIVYWNKHPFWYVLVDVNKTISFQGAVLNGIYILKAKINTEITLTLPSNIRYPKDVTFNNYAGITYFQFLYTTEDYENYYYDLIAIVEGLV